MEVRPHCLRDRAIRLEVSLLTRLKAKLARKVEEELGEQPVASEEKEAKNERREKMKRTGTDALATQRSGSGRQERIMVDLRTWYWDRPYR